jgi:hypothetical protein
MIEISQIVELKVAKHFHWNVKLQLKHYPKVKIQSTIKQRRHLNDFLFFLIDLFLRAEKLYELQASKI